MDMIVPAVGATVENGAMPEPYQSRQVGGSGDTVLIRPRATTDRVGQPSSAHWIARRVVARLANPMTAHTWAVVRCATGRAANDET